ncbi:MAG: hypothetical protein KKD44_06055 [Proteobacteria bacterium]|nr:hypothetical protein [Pseudomonadota bacterium]
MAIMILVFFCFKGPLAMGASDQNNNDDKGPGDLKHQDRGTETDGELNNEDRDIASQMEMLEFMDMLEHFDLVDDMEMIEGGGEK